ncbi:hypothetical protein CHS0354_026679 [Potamilus streckersoni]|uniref:Uncharacterized protein n=1 Tax=Potamilus streckersoni TaxID=2493646 RepID=A0AAE0S820_9BIVA|nr:hypothetical protein CHS0354_026679 [Potamilus streckersoni]
MPLQAGEKIRADCGQEVTLHAGKKNILRWGKIVHFQMHTIFRQCPFQEGEKMGQNTEIPCQASENIRANSGQEVPLKPGKKNICFPTSVGEKKMGLSTEMPFQAVKKIRARSAGEKIRADSGEEVPLQAGKKNILRWGKLFVFRCTQYLGNALSKRTRKSWARVPKVISSEREDKGRLWPGSSFYDQEIRISSSIKSGREEDGTYYLNALSSGREDKGRLVRKNFTRKKEEYLKVGKNCSYSDVHNILVMPFPRGREEDEPEYRNAFSRGRENKGRLWPGSPFSTRKEKYLLSYNS